MKTKNCKCHQCEVDGFDADEGRYNERDEFTCDSCAELNKEQREAHRRGLTWAEYVYGRRL